MGRVVRLSDGVLHPTDGGTGRHAEEAPHLAFEEKVVA
jgi:hypothetical protein